MKTRFLMITVGLLMAAGGWPCLAVEEEEIPETNILVGNFGAWADALENRSNTDAAWEFPFDAPRPSGLDDRDLEAILTLRRLVVTRNLIDLEPVVDRVARRTEPLPAPLKFWLAYALGIMERNQPCLANLTELLNDPEAYRDLENGQIAWVLTGISDRIFLSGNKNEAGELYSRLAASPLEQLNLWGNYQLAGLDFLARNFSEADRRYQLVCDSEKSGSWREHACEMATFAAQLATLGKEGSGHGIAANVAP